MRNLFRSRALLFASALLLSVSCGGMGAQHEELSRTAPAGSDASPPSPNERIPRKADRLAEVIEANEAALLHDLFRWRRNGAHLWGSRVKELKLRALYQQRITRRLADRRRLSNRVLRRLESRTYWFYRANIKASRTLSALASGTPPKEPPRFKYAPPEPPNRLMRYYETGHRRFHVPPRVLASVNFVETKFGRVLGPSSAGAQGPMQFLPSTWDAYGNGGDIWDPHDSIVAAARYLRASGAPARMRDALYSYNPSEAYVKTILIYERQIRQHRYRYYNYYLWQVFVRTREGTIQMTGPGSPRPGY